jgi:hypothetical protein
MNDPNSRFIGKIRRDYEKSEAERIRKMKRFTLRVNEMFQPQLERNNATTTA